MFRLETPRLSLRELTLSDLDLLFEIFSDEETMKYYPSVKSREETVRWINWNIDSYKTNRFGLWAVIHKKDNRFIGDCGITLQDIDGEIKPEIGYHIHRSYWNQGYATEAALCCRDYCFEKFQFDELFVKTNVENLASVKVAEKIGMSLQKTYPSKSRPGKKTYSFSVSREFWTKNSLPQNEA